MGDMSRLNDLISKTTHLSSDSKNSILVTKLEFDKYLKEINQNSFDEEVKIELVRKDNNNIMLDMLKVENDVTEFEKKIHQERTQNSKIDPSLGKNDAIGMEKEIRR